MTSFICIIQTSLALEGQSKQETFVGPYSKHNIYYDIYLPKGYNSSKKKYPVIYFLHGKGTGRDTPRPNKRIFPFYDKAINSGKIPPFIVVAPNSRAANMWADAKDKSSLAETYVIKELIPHIDSKYRTIPTRKSRFIEGFSMGGYGAALYGCKFSEIFSSAICLDSALHSWGTLRGRNSSIAKGIFDMDEKYFNKYNPYFLASLNSKEINKNSFEFLIYVGALDKYNETFKSTLEKNKIKFKYIDTPLGHSKNVRDHDQEAYFNFIKRKLAEK